jgi:hypothetical protein
LLAGPLLDSSLLRDVEPDENNRDGVAIAAHVVMLRVADIKLDDNGVGPEGIALSILFPFRFLHPRLLMPWAAIERCETVRFLGFSFAAPSENGSLQPGLKLAGVDDERERLAASRTGQRHP